MTTFVIQGRLNGTNDIIRFAAYNRFLGGNKRRIDKTKCITEIYMQNRRLKAHYAKPVRVYFAWVEPNAKRDLDNITGGQKVILDALVACGVIPNDTREWVTGISHIFPTPDKKNPRIIVTLEESLT